VRRKRAAVFCDVSDCGVTQRAEVGRNDRDASKRRERRVGDAVGERGSSTDGLVELTWA
jgi:hypothetical protein